MSLQKNLNLKHFFFIFQQSFACIRLKITLTLYSVVSTKKSHIHTLTLHTYIDTFSCRFVYVCMTFCKHHALKGQMLLFEQTTATKNLWQLSQDCSNSGKSFTQKHFLSFSFSFDLCCIFYWYQ